MKRVVIVGPGGAGKSTLAVRVSAVTGIPVVELDERFWRPGLVPTPPDEWTAVQHELVARDSWILDGDLGPYDMLEVRLRAADTIVVLDFSRWRCAWRAVRRSREGREFWRWLWTWPQQHRPLLMDAVAVHAPDADLHVLRNPRAVEHFLVALKALDRGDRGPTLG